MKSNILVVSYNQNLSKQVAEELATEFSMRVFSAIELFEFDNAPRSLSEMIAIRGASYVKQELAGIVKFSTDYENVVFVADLSMHETCKDFLLKIISSYVVVLLKDEPEKEEQVLLNRNYDQYEKELYFYNQEGLEIAENAIGEYADVVVNINNRNNAEIAAEIVEAIKTIYNVN